MKDIRISIRDKISNNVSHDTYVCGNSDYRIVFDFDEEWEAHPVKTARIKYGGVYQEVVFTGNVCDFPIIHDARMISVGVYAGNLSTTTPAIITAYRSILSGDEAHTEPTEDVYNQLVGLVEAGAVRGESGGYYTPTVTQPESGKMRVGFTPSKSSMPTVMDTEITMPSGGDMLASVYDPMGKKQDVFSYVDAIRDWVTENFIKKSEAEQMMTSKIQLTFGPDFEGKTYTITGGANETYTGTVPATLIVTQTIKTINTEYVVTCTNADGVTYERVVTIGSYYGVYQSEFVFFRAYLVCTADAGCTVIATNGNKTYSGVSDSNGEVTLNIGATGTYSVTASKDGATTEAVTVEVTEAGATYTCKLPSLSVPEIVSWADGTDEQISAMVAALEDGTLTVEDTGWAVGDKRTVQLGAMAATGVGESHEAQTVQLVLSHAGATKGITRADGKPIHFQVDQVNSLNEPGYMNSSRTNSGSWNGCARRTWCNAIYYNAIPEALRPIFKQMKVTTAETYNGSTLKESEDFFALRAEQEIFGTRSYSNSTEAAALEQIDWYKTAANRKKLRSGSADAWWERSPNASNSALFCRVNSSGGANYNPAADARGLAPFGCI